MSQAATNLDEFLQLHQIYDHPSDLVDVTDDAHFDPAEKMSKVEAPKLTTIAEAHIHFDATVYSGRVTPDLIAFRVL